MESVKENQKMSRKEIEFMRIKNTIKRFSGILFAMVLAAAFLLPVQAASYYKYNSGRLVINPNNSRQKQAITTGGSAYDDRGYGLNAFLCAGVEQINGNEEWNSIPFRSSTSKSVASGYYNDVLGGLYYCGPEDKAN